MSVQQKTDTRLTLAFTYRARAASRIFALLENLSKCCKILSFSAVSRGNLSSLPFINAAACASILSYLHERTPSLLAEIRHQYSPSAASREQSKVYNLSKLCAISSALNDCWMNMLNRRIQPIFIV